MAGKIIIIGGGMAGLTAGIYARLNGYDAEILEMHSRPGGQCTSWKRKDYTFDYSVHWLVGSSHGAFNNIWRETRALDDIAGVIDLEDYAIIRLKGGEDLMIYSDIDRWEDYLQEFAPGDSEAIREMCTDIRRASTLTIIEKAPDLRNPLDLVRFGLKSYPAMKVFARCSRLSLRDYLRRLGFSNERLISGLLASVPSSTRFSSIAFLLTLAWFSKKNAGYPIGGSMALITRMLDRFVKLGGVFSGERKVEKILVQDHRAVGVKLEGGEEIRADGVVGACDLYTMIHDMLEGRYITPELERAFKEWPLFNPVVMVSFGIDRPVEAKSHTLHVLAAGQRVGSTVLDSAFSVYNYNHDPLITPPGKCVMQLYFESPMALWEAMGDEEYAAEKERIITDATRCLELLFPGVSGHIEVTDVATPLTDIRYTGVWKGSYEGFMPANINMGKGIKNTIKGLSNFYLAGQWLFPGGGLPPTAQSGKWAIQMICHGDGKKFMVK
jgi:phytoene dehydrogenase-like protein